MRIKSVDIQENGMQVVVLDDAGKPTTFTYFGDIQSQLSGGNDGGVWITLNVTPRKSESLISKLKNDWL